MASEDVIELGSSDEEAEPAPKKRKPTPNAMVHIPSKLPGITIKPAKSVPSSANNKGILMKPIVVNKSNLGMNTPANRIKPMRLDKTSTAMMVPIQNRIVRKDIKNAPLVKNKSAINPISIVQNLNKAPIAMKKLTQIMIQKNIEMKGKKFLNKLPPSITIKPVCRPNITIKPIQKAGSSGIHKRGRIVGPKRKPPGEIMTVEIDDEDTSESANASPQWYMRPEDEKAKNIKQDNDSSMKVDSVEPSMEEKNNKEPDKTNYVEITIEDSPLKPPVISKHPDIGKELTITIEDSPVKPIAKAIKDVESDSEINEVMEDKQSKKKLYYPKESKNNKANHVVEIEIDLRESTPTVESECKIQPASPKHKSNEEIEKSQKQDSGTEKVEHSKEEASLVVEQAKGIIIEDDEFHPTYQKFIQMCFQLENTEDMKKIVEKKIKAYYRQCPKDYVESEEFIDMVSSKIVSMKASPEKMYLYIKDIVDELNLQRKMAKSAVVTKKVDTEIKSFNVRYEESQYDSKKQRQIRKLEKTIKKLHRAIQKLEEQEVDFDDDEDSVYLLTERYKERMVRVHAKFCQLTNTKMPSEPRIHIEARPGRPTGPAKKLEKWVNRKVPIGTPLPFPDFHDVIRCVREANEEDKLGWTDIDVMEEARDLFTRCGKKLQRRRQENEWRIAASRISVEIDPAESSLDLKKKLDENKTVAAKRETELLNKYVDRQNLLKLEAEEIGDKEAEESPVESEEEDVVENDNSMEDKQKRKRRLKRLIHEKSKKDEDKENLVAKDSEETNNETKDVVSKDIEEGKENKETTGEKSNNDELVVEPLPNETEATKDKEEDRNSLKNDKDNEDNDSDTYKVESDVDELHLLQKLHSENEANTSTLESSDSDTPIAISDTLDSDSEQENGAKSYDVISIENSSYSESEMIIDSSPKECDSNSLNKQNVEELVTANFEIEYSSTGIKDTNKETPVKEATIGEVEENILLASSDEEVKDKADNKETENTCINLRDDNISISETIVDAGAIEQENVSNDENIIPENSNALELIEVSPDVEENDETVDIIQENIEDDGNSNTIQECSRMEEGINDVDDLPKDVVEIRSASDVNSVESTDLQTDTENNEDTNDHTEIMDTTEPNCLEISLITKNAPGNKIQNKISVEEAINDHSATTETSNCDMNMEI